MIEIIYPDKPVETRKGPISFQEIQEFIGGFVELNYVVEGKKTVQVCCNENGLSLGLPSNSVATQRFQRKLLISRSMGAVGTWVVLSGKDLLR